MWPGQYCPSWDSRGWGSWGLPSPHLIPGSTPSHPTLVNIMIFRVIITRPLSKVDNVSVCRPLIATPAICRRAAAQGYEDLYFPLVEVNRLRCVTNCMHIRRARRHRL